MLRRNKYLVIKALLLPLFCTASVVAVAAQALAQGLPGVAAPVAAAQSPYVYVKDISIEGNRKTRSQLILRELEFAIGDSIAVETLVPTLQRNSLRLMNLGIFASANINVLQWDTQNRLSLHIRLVEGWYIYPVPLFELADRNFNVWWKEFGRSLSRVNYGLDLNWLNLTGNADLLKTKLQFGYANKYELAYRRPNLNKNQTLGLQTALSYARTREVAYATVANKLAFLTDRDNWVFSRLTASAGLSWRPKLFTTHTFTAEFHRNTVDDRVQELNPAFFRQGRTLQRHLSLIYNLSIDRLDIRPFPLSGYLSTVELRQNGILPGDDLFLTRLLLEHSHYFPLHPKWSVALSGTLRLSLPRQAPPYFNNQALGYGSSFVRGYEYYVADGLDFGLLKTDLHFQVFSRTFHLGRLMPLQAFKNLPLKIYLSLNNDLGYANDPHYPAQNPLSNRLLYGYGLGLDIVAYYDKTARIEWSRNDRGESGFFLRVNTGF
jgi:hypothetical protein